MACIPPLPEATPGWHACAIAPARWYVRPALEARRKLSASALVAVATVAGCGGGERQDAHEPKGSFAVDVVRASFPAKQRLAQKSQLEIVVRNAGDKTIPNMGVTVNGFNYRSTQPDVADPERPQFAVNGVPRKIGGFPEAKTTTPEGCDTAYVNTWACGPLRPGREKSFLWQVTAVRAGPYKISWRVSAGLNGKATAVSSGAPIHGLFAGSVSNSVPKARVADDGKTVIIGTR
jgi:hypothetical protein